MARTKRAAEPLPTIWHASDELWEHVQQVLDEFDPPSNYGPDRIDQRAAFDGVIYRMRSGVQWNHLPREFGDDASVHRTFQRWVKRGVIGRLWALLVRECEELGGVDWQWQSFDCALGKARHGGIKSDRTRPTGGRTARSAACSRRPTAGRWRSSSRRRTGTIR
jgi:transposase